MTHACWTAVAPLVAPDAATRMHVAGYTGGIASCIDFAVDGYTIMGSPLYYRIGVDIDISIITLTADAIAMTHDELVTKAQFALTTNDPSASAPRDAVNLGQIRQLYRDLNTTQPWNCALFTAHEYYSPSAVICFKALKTDDIETAKMISAAGTASSNIMTIANYGSIYGIYGYDKDGTGAFSAQTVDHFVAVGTLDGAGVLGKQKLAIGV